MARPRAAKTSEPIQATSPPTTQAEARIRAPVTAPMSSSTATGMTAMLAAAMTLLAT